jgi:hypothetical protein
MRIENQINCSKFWFQWNIIHGDRLSHWMRRGLSCYRILNLKGSFPKRRPGKREKDHQFAKDGAWYCLYPQELLVIDILPKCSDLSSSILSVVQKAYSMGTYKKCIDNLMFRVMAIIDNSSCICDNPLAFFDPAIE